MSDWSRRFEKECRRLQEAMGLLDWCFRFQPKKGDGTLSAEVTHDPVGREALFCAHLDTIQDDTPERIGLHEVLHVLLSDLLHTAIKRGSADHEDVEREEHRVIERLCNYMLGRP